MKILIALFVCLSWLPVHAASLAVGDALPTMASKDQFGKDFILTTNVQFLLVATEMNSAKVANQKLAEQGLDFLEKHNAAYLMDVHTMPAVARWFAFPKFRKYPHRIVLIDSAETLAAVPAQTNCVTLLAISPARRIKKISYWNPVAEPVTAIFK